MTAPVLPFLLSLVLASASSVAQVKSVESPRSSQPFASYGPAEPVDLPRIAHNGEQYQRQHVVTSGVLKPMGAGPAQYLILADGTWRVLLIPALPPDGSASRLLGRQVELKGVVRLLPSRQDNVACHGTLMLESQCEDPELPALPNARTDWPPVSITFFSMSEVGLAGPAGGVPGGVSLAELASKGSDHVGQTVTVTGLFGGRNLFGDLPAGSERSPSDWVLRLGSSAVWVTGKKAEGKGWRLDPAYRGDAVRWLQVTGRVESANGVTFLRASKVALANAPKAADDEP